MKFSLPVLSLLFLSVFPFSAVSQTPNDSDDVVKITTKLVQVDVVVTDKSGSQVRDLKAADFELTQDGKRQQISAVSYVAPPQPAAVVTDIRAGSKNTLLPAGSAAAKSRNSTGRVIAFLVDDGSCSATIWGLDVARRAVAKFVREKMQPDDLVAIYRTRAGSSAFQQYTSDKASLVRATEKIKWYPPQGSCSVSDGTGTDPARANTFNKLTNEGVRTITIESDAERQIREYNEDWNASNQLVGTLGVMRYAITGLARSPGRKTMFVLSDGIAIRNRQNTRVLARDIMRDVTEAANRAAVVVHTFDLRAGGNPGMIEAKDEVIVQDDFNATDPISRGRLADSNRLQEGLTVLAEDTGGEFFRGTDGTDGKMESILNREAGYYLIAYEPDESSFKGKNFNKIDVKVLRPDLKVLHRAGFVGLPDAEATKRVRKNEYSDLYEAIAAPLPKPGLDISMMASFGNSSDGNNFVRSIMHVDGSELSFIDEPGGKKKVVLDVVAVTLDEKNDVIDEFTRTHTLRLDASGAERISRDGFVYTTDIPIKKAGNYNFRVAVRDASSKMIGTAGQSVQIPDLKRADVFLSGLSVSGVDQNGKFEAVISTTAENAITLPSSGSTPSIRRFKAGAVVAYAYSIYNSRVDKTTKKPNVAITVNLYKDGNLVVPGKEAPAQFEEQADWKRIHDFGYIRLNPQAEAGEYALQVIVRDLLGGKNSITSQWIDLEVVN